MPEMATGREVPRGRDASVGASLFLMRNNGRTIWSIASLRRRPSRHVPSLPLMPTTCRPWYCTRATVPPGKLSGSELTPIRALNKRVACQVRLWGLHPIEGSGVGTGGPPLRAAGASLHSPSFAGLAGRNDAEARDLGWPKRHLAKPVVRCSLRNLRHETTC